MKRQNFKNKKSQVVITYYMLIVILGLILVSSTLVLSLRIKDKNSREIAEYLGKNILERIKKDIIEIRALAEIAEIENVTKTIYIPPAIGDSKYSIRGDYGRLIIKGASDDPILETENITWDIDVRGLVFSSNKKIKIQYSETDNPGVIYLK